MLALLVSSWPVMHEHLAGKTAPGPAPKSGSRKVPTSFCDAITRQKFPGPRRHFSGALETKLIRRLTLRRRKGRNQFADAPLSLESETLLRARNDPSQLPATAGPLDGCVRSLPSSEKRVVRDGPH